MSVGVRYFGSVRGVRVDVRRLGIERLDFVAGLAVVARGASTIPEQNSLETALDRF